MKDDLMRHHAKTDLSREGEGFMKNNWKKGFAVLLAASINAGGLGILLFEGLRTMNIPKILWGSVLSAGMAVLLNAVLKMIAERM